MQRLVLPFTTEDIVIATPDQISQQQWADLAIKLGTALTNLLLSLHPLEANSILSKLHNSGVGFEVEINLLFVELMEINAKYHSLTNGNFSLIDPAKISLDLESMTAKLTEDVKIKHTQIFTEFALYILDKELKLTSIENYLITGPHSYIARGSQAWEVNFSYMDLEQKIEMVIQNETTTMYYLPYTPKANFSPSPFSHTSILPGLAAVIIESQDLIHAKVAATQIVNLEADFQFKQFVHDWNCGATLLFEDGSFKQFKA
jgi:hypothetical protein